MRIGRAAFCLATVLIAAAPASAAKGPVLLSAADLDPALVLPRPPAPGSAEARSELRELHDIERWRSAADVKAARSDSETKNASIFSEVLGPAFDLSRLPATTALMAMVRATEKDSADRGKAEFQRARPWIVDPALKTCERSDEPLSSYPSGHTTMAFSMAAVLARLVPQKAPALLSRAARYGQSRIVCEQHFRSDVTAGQVLGTLVAERLMTKPEFLAAFEAARRELAGAGVIPR